MYGLKIKSLCIYKSPEESKEFLDACIAHAIASRDDAGNCMFSVRYTSNEKVVKVIFEELWVNKSYCDKHLVASKARPHIEVINRYRDYKEVVYEFEDEEDNDVNE